MNVGVPFVTEILPLKIKAGSNPLEPPGLRGNIPGAEPGKGRGGLLARRRISMSTMLAMPTTRLVSGEDHDLILLLFLGLFARVSSAEFGELTLPRTVHVFAENPASLRVRKADWMFLKFSLVLSLVLEEVQNYCLRAGPDSDQQGPVPNRVKVVQEDEQASGYESKEN